MTWIVRWTLVLLICLSGTGIGWAQEHDDNVETDLSFIWGIPHGAYADNTTAPGIGISGSVGGRVPGLPVVLFSEIGFLSYGSDNHLELTQIQEQFQDVDFTAPVSVVSVESDNKILMGHLVTRLQPSLGVFEPYLDALFGFKYFFTDTQIDSDVVFDWNSLEASSNFDDLVPSFGAGGGVQIRVFRGHLGSDSRPSSLSINLGIRYLFGPEATYLTHDAIQQTDDGIRFTTERSRTDMLIPKFGLRIER